MVNRSVLEALLSAFLIIMIIITVFCNIIILTAIYRLRNRNYYRSLTVLCVYTLTASLVVLPCMLAVVANKELVSLADGDKYFCQFFGIMSSFLHRASTSSLCLAYVDRYVLIWKPMIYTTHRRCILCTFISLWNFLVALTFAASPFGATDTSDWAYTALHNTPLCAFNPTTVRGRVLLITDAIYSFGFMWLIMATASAGLLMIACLSASKKRKIVPIALGTFKEKSGISGRLIPTAWSARSSTAAQHCKVNKDDSTDEPIATVAGRKGSLLAKRHFPTSALEQFEPEEKVSENRKRKYSRSDSISLDSDFFEPQRKKSIVAANVIFRDELTLNKDGTARWMSTTSIATTSKDKSLPFSIERELTVEKINYKNKNSQTIQLSSLIRQNQERPKRFKHSKRRSTKIQRSLRRKVSRRKALFQLNTKALTNIAITLLLFTLLIVPVTILEVLLVTQQEIYQGSDYFSLRTVVCLSFALQYFTFPLMNVMADKDIKNEISLIFKRIFVDNDFETNHGNLSHDSLDG